MPGRGIGGKGPRRIRKGSEEAPGVPTLPARRKGEAREILSGMGGEDRDETLFSAVTRLGFSVRVTRRQWEKIVSEKHPVMVGREDDVRRALSDPNQIRQSKSDPTVFLFYAGEKPGRWLSAIVKKVDNDDGFLITAYPTDAIKEGEQRWTK
jgi:hypothetical protein